VLHATIDDRGFQAFNAAAELPFGQKGVRVRQSKCEHAHAHALL
jgi:hypothetical protein